MGVFSRHEKDYLEIVDRLGSLANFILDVDVYFRKKVTQSGLEATTFPLSLSTAPSACRFEMRQVGIVGTAGLSTSGHMELRHRSKPWVLSLGNDLNLNCKLILKVNITHEVACVCPQHQAGP